MEQSEVTELLKHYKAGDHQALEAVFTSLYGELKKLAAHFMRRESSEMTLQATALLHEAYFKIRDQQQGAITNRGQFFALAARMMRRILIDAARVRLAKKRGGDATHLPLTEALPQINWDDERLVELDEALKSLAEEDKRAADVINLKYFVGCELDAIAEILDISLATVKRDMSFAKAWLYRKMEQT